VGAGCLGGKSAIDIEAVWWLGRNRCGGHPPTQSRGSTAQRGANTWVGCVGWQGRTQPAAVAPG
jgi:hypothetical protein